MSTSITIPANLYQDLIKLIESARKRAAVAVNSNQVLLYWSIGQRLYADVLKENKPEYGKAVIETLGSQLKLQYGRGFSSRNLFKMIQFYKSFPEQILPTLSAKLYWSHFVELLSLEDETQRQFYAELCHLEHWDVRTLRDKIQTRLFERTALAKQPKATVQQELEKFRQSQEPSPMLVFRDPYILDFLQLHDDYQENDLENAIITELEAFIRELGADFCFVARQQRMTVNYRDYWLDLLFFHRGLRRLIAIELKLEEFTPAHKGQMELYLRWLDKYMRKPHEEAPLGIILCHRKNHELVELLELDQSGIHVAQYLTDLPPKTVLEEKLQQAIAIAKQRLTIASQA